ncbi:MAG TPA: AI-2E family transporter [Candidatus Deferrimicrobiaceae bacterium]
MYRNVIAPLIACTLLAFLAYFVYRLAQPFLAAIGLGAVLTVITFPLYERLRRRLGGREGAAAILMVLLVLFLLIVPTLGLLGALGQQATEVYHWFGKTAARNNPVQPLLDKLDSYRGHPILGRIAEWVRPQIESLAADATQTVPEGMKKLIGTITGMLTSFLANALKAFLDLVLALAALGIFYTRGESLLGEVAALVPLPRERSRELFARLGEVTKAVMKGVGLTCLAQGALGGLGFWAAGLPSPLLFGTVMAFTALIPVVGTAIVWLPGVLYLFFTGQTTWGVGLLLWNALVVGQIDNVLRPLLIGGKAGMPLPLLIVGILGGLFSFGLMGLVIGPLVLTVLLFVLEERHRTVPGADEPSPPAAPGLPPAAGSTRRRHANPARPVLLAFLAAAASLLFPASAIHGQNPLRPSEKTPAGKASPGTAAARRPDRSGPGRLVPPVFPAAGYPGGAKLVS